MRWCSLFALFMVCGCGKASPPRPRAARCTVTAQNSKAFSDCGDARDEATCQRAGGRWSSGHQEKRWACDCAAPDDGCPCSSWGECTHLCLVPLREDQTCAPASAGICRSAHDAPSCAVGDDGAVRRLPDQ